MQQIGAREQRQAKEQEQNDGRARLRNRPDQDGRQAESLLDELSRSVQGEVRFDNGSRALYATDASNYRQAPIGVVVPRSQEDILATVAACRRRGIPILPRGGGTSLAGQCCNVALVMDMSKYYNRVLEIDPEGRTARIQPGLVLDRLQDATKKHDLMYGPDPATHRWCTLGGMLGNNSCGVHSVVAGKSVDNVEELEVLTYNGLRLRVGATGDDELARIIAAGGPRGEIYRRLKAIRDDYADLIRRRFPDIPRRVSGYNLDQLLPEHDFNVARALVGSEGTCVTILEAKVGLIDRYPGRALLVLGYPDVYTAADHVPEIMAFKPVGLEGFDHGLVEFMQEKELHAEDLGLLPAGRGWLLVEFGARSAEEARDRARQAMAELKQRADAPQMRLYDDARQEQRIWEIRESGLGATAHAPGKPDMWPGWEDSAVRPDSLGDYLRDLRGLLDRHNYNAAFYGHFGQACLHCRIDFDLRTRPGIDKYMAFIQDASDLVLRYGGSLSGEHGDGQSRAWLWPKMFGPELMPAFREFKAIWDPDGKMNPGKLVDPYGPDQNLRLGVTYDPWEPKTAFQYPADGYSFSQAMLRCVGVGKCRRTEEGTMCPSYQVLREEKHATRGRAHLLFEMLQGDVIRGRWRDENVKEALDLCLACKGCKGDCPVGVDMATYKAEFFAHYYAGRLRPRAAYAFGLIYWWSELAALAPGLANAATQTPLLRGLAKAAAGVAAERQIPAFAPRTFRSWFAARPPRNPDKPAVILWADTFNNHFHPDTLAAGVEVLEAAGFRVVVPAQHLCCGRPLYDWGMLGPARRLLQDVLTSLRDDIAAGTPIVGLEPSCVSVFRDELGNLFPHDENARRLGGQVLTLAEFMQQRAGDYKLPRLARKAVVHGHCHHKAVMRMHAEEALLGRLGLDYDLLDAGCCGMAGAFGFAKGEKYRVSRAAGERVLLPAVRQAAANTLIVADGFSCREQIRQGTDREALHLAQVLRMAIGGEDRAGGAGQAADQTMAAGGNGQALARLALPLATAALVAGGALLQQYLSRRQKH